MSTTVDLYKSVKENILKLIKESNPTTNITNVDSFSIIAGGALSTPETVTINGVDVVLDTYADIKGNPYYGFTGDVRFKYKRIDLTELESFQDTASIYRVDTTPERDCYEMIVNNWTFPEGDWYNKSHSSLTSTIMLKKATDAGLKDEIGGGTKLITVYDTNREPTYYDANQNYCNRVVTINFYNIHKDAIFRSINKVPSNDQYITRALIEFGENKVWLDATSQPTSKFLYKGRYIAKIDYK